ncbi:LacI family DNA-binding transcriptional regulator [Nocardia terpenica]|nr:LacI family DNA-binding transcriptional regulator [Nocardia terpenica]
MSTAKSPSGTASIRDVARQAGVSPATASRALRGDTAVVPETRERVVRAARELAYTVPGRRPRLVGVLARYPTQWFFANAITAIERSLRVAGYGLVLYNIGDSAGRQLFFEEVLPRRELDGLLIVATSFEPRERAALDAAGVPIVVLGGGAPGLPRAGIDDAEGARMAVRHLLGLGHRDIGLISFAPEGEGGLETVNARRAGMLSALADAQAQPRPEWLITRESTVHGGVLATEELLTRSRLPSALFAMSDEMALGTLATLRRAGIAVPGQISVIGFDDHEMAAIFDLTTIRQPVHEQARTATELLLNELAGPGPDGGPSHNIDLPTRLVVRGTTGPVGESPRDR